MTTSPARPDTLRRFGERAIRASGSRLGMAARVGRITMDALEAFEGEVDLGTPQGAADHHQGAWKTGGTHTKNGRTLPNERVEAGSALLLGVQNHFNMVLR